MRLVKWQSFNAYGSLLMMKPDDIQPKTLQEFNMLVAVDECIKLSYQLNETLFFIKDALYAKKEAERDG